MNTNRLTIEHIFILCFLPSHRNSGIATTFLTTVAFLYVLTSLLPKTAYSTLINHVVFLSFATQIAVWVVVNFNFIANKDDPDTAQDVDLIFAILLPSVFFFGTAVLIVPKLLRWHCGGGSSFPDKDQLVPVEDMIRDWRYPIYSKKNELAFFPFK